MTDRIAQAHRHSAVPEAKPWVVVNFGFGVQKLCRVLRCSASSASLAPAVTIAVTTATGETGIATACVDAG
jgi:glycerol uptake facilitator-like aquaporin